MNENIIKAFNLLAVDILDLFHKVLASDVGINRKHKNIVKNNFFIFSFIQKSTFPIKFKLQK